MSFWSSLAWKPSSPFRTDRVRSPSSVGSVEAPSFATRRIRPGLSSSRSKASGVLRNAPAFCCRKTLTAPKKTRSIETSGPSVLSGVYVGMSETSCPCFIRAPASALSCRQVPQYMLAAPAAI